MVLETSQICRIVVSFIFLFIFNLSGCNHQNTECAGKPPRAKIDELEDFGAFHRKVLKPYVEPSDELTPSQEKTLNSLEKLDDYPLFSMHYYADYHLDEYLEVGIDTADAPKRETPACSSFSVLNQADEMLFGRNLDFDRLPLLVLYNHPPEGYDSISVVPIPEAFDERDLHKTPIEERRRLLYAPFFTVDGMNEHGFTISEMTVPGEDVYDPEKVSLISLQIQRLLLDRAKDIDEAIQLLRQYNNLDSYRIHYLIADASGKSAVVEYYEDEILVTRNSSESWQVATNFMVLDRPSDELVNDCGRYKSIYRSLDKSDGHITMDDAMDILDNVSVSCRTQHSAVYNLSGGKMEITVGRNYGQVYSFSF